jgi:hypothetical protein
MVFVEYLGLSGSASNFPFAFFFFFGERGADRISSVAQAGRKLTILLPLSLEC